ncbi:MAG: S41 family peptidase [Acidobacteriota bacterium]|jgi:carboxyl-terminal processing protease
MSIRGKLTLITVSAFIVIYSVIGGVLPRSSNPFVRALADPGPYPQLRIFEEVVRHIVNDYVEKPNLEKVRVGALRGLADGLDPYSAYLLPAQVTEYLANKDKGDTTGLVIGQYSGFAYVIAIVPDSPAEKAGLRVGDVIEYINGQATRDLGLYDVKSLLLGPVGTPIELSLINRKAGKLKLVPGLVPSTPVESRLLEGQIGYLKLPILNKGESARVESALRDLLKKGAKSLVLDLRGSAGGDTTEGLTVADYFLSTGTIVKLIGRKDKEIKSFSAQPDNDLTSLPVAAIVDRTTAGASEIIAASILDNQRGDVIGERTVFGMSAEQQLFKMDDGSALLLTVSRYASPAGKIFMNDGVMPNIEVKRPDLAEVSEDENQPPAPDNGAPAPPVVVAPKPTDDVMLKKAVETLRDKVKKS